jgi:hypothetical protein
VMIHVATTEAGAFEWSCTECSRRILLRWPPNYEKLVLDRGDETVSHGGGTGGTRINVEISPSPDDDDRAWLAANGIAWQKDRPA